MNNIIFSFVIHYWHRILMNLKMLICTTLVRYLDSSYEFLNFSTICTNSVNALYIIVYYSMFQTTYNTYVIRQPYRTVCSVFVCHTTRLCTRAYKTRGTFWYNTFEGLKLSTEIIRSPIVFMTSYLFI